jgi:hypothetical protein
MSKTLDTTSITNELKGASAFFSPTPSKKPISQQTVKPEVFLGKKGAPVAPALKPDAGESRKPRQAASPTEARKDAAADVPRDAMTSFLHDVNKKLWRERIEETETHNSSLRISAKEREQIEDMVRDLKRKYRIKTSMNEIARLGLLFLAHEFRKRGTESIIAEVKTS